jgi:hypothetical protein
MNLPHTLLGCLLLASPFPGTAGDPAPATAATPSTPSLAAQPAPSRPRRQWSDYARNRPIPQRWLAPVLPSRHWLPPLHHLQRRHHGQPPLPPSRCRHIPRLRPHQPGPARPRPGRLRPRHRLHPALPDPPRRHPHGLVRPARRAYPRTPQGPQLRTPLPPRRRKRRDRPPPH